MERRGRRSLQIALRFYILHNKIAVADFLLPKKSTAEICGALLIY